MAEAERTLFGQRGKTDIQNVPAGAAGLYLLAHAQECQGKQKEAIKHYKLALERDPTLWCAFERLGKMVPNDVEAQKVFKEQHPAIQSLNQQIVGREEQQSPQILPKKEI
jgi:tetratricopeptide (TPR) repeat protein